jgi:hypothetical protein
MNSEKALKIFRNGLLSAATAKKRQGCRGGGSQLRTSNEHISWATISENYINL